MFFLEVFSVGYDNFRIADQQERTNLKVVFVLDFLFFKDIVLSVSLDNVKRDLNFFLKHLFFFKKNVLKKIRSLKNTGDVSILQLTQLCVCVCVCVCVREEEHTCQLQSLI